MRSEKNHPVEDLTQIEFGDKRITERLSKSVEKLTANAQKSILGSEGNRSGAKAFYRLLSNPKLDIDKLSESVMTSTINRMQGTVLLIEDTSDINLNGHKKSEGLGFSSEHVRGIKLHSCIAITPEGLPLGLVKQYYETRPEPKSSLTEAEKAARKPEEKESYRWIQMLDESTGDIPTDVQVITICDREGDFYELYAQAERLGEDFIIRLTHDRVTDDEIKVLSQIRGTKASGEVEINIPRNSRAGTLPRIAKMEVAYCSVRIKKPAHINDESLPETLKMNIVRITEIDAEGVKEPIEWILATSLPVNNVEDAMTIVNYYVQRWKIERFHFVLKSGCNAEKIQQRSFEKIKIMLLIYSVIAMYIMTITYIGRILPDMTCDAFFDKDEWQILYRITLKTKEAPSEPYSMADAVKYLGWLGGYKRSPSDGPPGLKVIWNGLFKLWDFIELFAGQV
jgi:hypothetical protein